MRKILSSIAWMGFVVPWFYVSGAWGQDRSSFVLISDIDDTFKITNVRDTGSTLYNGLFGGRTFVGMPELYSALVEESNQRGTSFPEETGNFSFLSGSPTFLEGRLMDQFKKLNLPPVKYFLRNWFNGENTGQFKARVLEELAPRSELPFLLFGDDTEADPEVLENFWTSHPERVVKAYVHRVTGAAPVSQVIYYYTAFDVALQEYEEGRLSAEKVSTVAQAVLDPQKAEDLFPDFSVCPTDFSLPESARVDQDPQLSELKARVIAYVRALCGQRSIMPQ